MFVDISKLDSHRETIDHDLARLAMDSSRTEARCLLATELGGGLLSEERCDYWYSVVLPESLLGFLDLSIFDSSKVHNLALNEIHGFERNVVCQALTREDSEMAAILKFLDPQCDLQMSTLDKSRCFHDDPEGPGILGINIYLHNLLNSIGNAHLAERDN